MNKYETVIILSDKINEEKRNNIIEKIKKYIQDNGEIEKIENIGLRNLAYEIKKCKQGYYLCIYFKAESDKITELERIYRITDEIIKFITIRNED